ncbi:MAG TPA: hypothetical protein VG756_32965 [Pseudonocardiaceae bacterium]|jgi:hypothetical protein|nr:hypothetical protein [Pseudonocardiaceae bacterium]
MRLSPEPLHQPDRSDLLRLAQDALRRATTAPGHRTDSPELVQQLGQLAGILGEFDSVVTLIQAELQRRVREHRLVVTEGPFVGEPEEALATTALWAKEARAASEQTRRAIENAHIAASGLAEAC